MRPESKLFNSQRGFSLVAAMFVMIVVALVIAGMVQLSVNQHGTSSLSIQQARAYQAARAGLEWGIHQALTGSCAASSSLTLTGTSLAAFSGVLVTCTVSNYSEASSAVRIYNLTATAQNGSPALLPDYAYRRLSAVLETAP